MKNFENITLKTQTRENQGLGHDFRYQIANLLVIPIFPPSSTHSRGRKGGDISEKFQIIKGGFYA